MYHPFQEIATDQVRRLFFPLLIATLLVMVIMNAAGAPLETEAAPLGIISFELAGSPEAAANILESWDEDRRVRAGFSLGFDYLFMALYSTTIALGCIWAGGVLNKRGWPLASAAAALAWGQWLAAVFDAVENLGLVEILFGGPGAPWAAVARGCAIAKFGLVFAGMAYTFYGLAVRLTMKTGR